MCVIATTAQAKSISSASLDDFCKQDQTVCMMFFSGYLTASEIISGLSESLTKDTSNKHNLDYGFALSGATTTLMGCAEYGVTPKQLVKVWQKYMADHPEMLHKSYRITIPTAFNEAFPCKN